MQHKHKQTHKKQQHQQKPQKNTNTYTPQLTNTHNQPNKNDKNIYKNKTPKTPKTQIQPITFLKIKNQTQVTPTNQKPKTNLPKNTHDKGYKIKKTTTTDPYKKSKSPIKPKTHKIKHFPHTHHKMQTPKSKKYKNEPTVTYTRNQIFITIHTTNSYKKIIITKITKKSTQTNKKAPQYNFYNKKELIKCGDIESNHGPITNLLLNHPQIHQERQKTTQIKSEYNHILELFKPYLSHTQTTNINQQLTQFYINNNHYPKSYLFYAILIHLPPSQHKATN
jgi:hypothetical protein